MQNKITRRSRHVTRSISTSKRLTTDVNRSSRLLSTSFSPLLVSPGISSTHRTNSPLSSYSRTITKNIPQKTSKSLYSKCTLHTRTFSSQIGLQQPSTQTSTPYIQQMHINSQGEVQQPDLNTSETGFSRTVRIEGNGLHHSLAALYDTLPSHVRFTSKPLDPLRSAMGIQEYFNTTLPQIINNELAGHLPSMLKQDDGTICIDKDSYTNLLLSGVNKGKLIKDLKAYSRIRARGIPMEFPMNILGNGPHQSDASKSTLFVTPYKLISSSEMLMVIDKAITSQHHQPQSPQSPEQLPLLSSLINDEKTMAGIHAVNYPRETAWHPMDDQRHMGENEYPFYQGLRPWGFGKSNDLLMAFLYSMSHHHPVTIIDFDSNSHHSQYQITYLPPSFCDGQHPHGMIKVSQSNVKWSWHDINHQLNLLKSSFDQAFNKVTYDAMCQSNTIPLMLMNFPSIVDLPISGIDRCFFDLHHHVWNQLRLKAIGYTFHDLPKSCLVYDTTAQRPLFPTPSPCLHHSYAFIRDLLEDPQCATLFPKLQSQNSPATLLRKVLRPIIDREILHKLVSENKLFTKLSPSLKSLLYYEQGDSTRCTTDVMIPSDSNVINAPLETIQSISHAELKKKILKAAGTTKLLKYELIFKLALLGVGAVFVYRYENLLINLAIMFVILSALAAA